MTSSLVGSEMCIRDSLWPPPQGNWVPSPGRASAAEANAYWQLHFCPTCRVQCLVLRAARDILRGDRLPVDEEGTAGVILREPDTAQWA
eukprot:4556519-Prorocentrum_lima.AAC.1